MIERARPSSKQDGFSVLEALVAMALLAAAFLPLLELQGRFVRTTEGLERASVRMADRQVAAQLARAVNFTAQPSSQIELGTRMIRWDATPVEPSRRARADYGVPTRFEVTLYDVDFTIMEQGSPSDAQHVRLRGLGWRPVVSVLDGL